VKELNPRGFLQPAAGLLFWPAAILARRSSKRLPLCFSTLGCPEWEWKTILKKAAKSVYAALELRGIRGEMDLTRSPVFVGKRLSRSQADLKALDLRVVNLGGLLQDARTGPRHPCCLQPGGSRR
jgi:hypothetical protein